MSDALRVLAVLALIAGNAFFVAAEFAVVTARRSALEARGGARRGRPAADGRPGPGHLDRAGRHHGDRHPHRRRRRSRWSATWSATGSRTPSPSLIAFVAVTYLSVVLGELVPKALTLDRAERWRCGSRGRWTSSPGPCGPRCAVLQRSARLVLRPVRRPGRRGRQRRDDARGAAGAGRRGRARRRDPAGPGGAPAQRLRVRRPRGARPHGPLARRRVARGPRGAGRGARPGAGVRPVALPGGRGLAGPGDRHRASARPAPGGRAATPPTPSRTSPGRRSSCRRPRTSARCCASCARRVRRSPSSPTSTADGGDRHGRGHRGGDRRRDRGRVRASRRDGHARWTTARSRSRAP